jgi:hypothetical protein
MNHIKFYEDAISNYDNSTELRVYMRAFYEMPLQKANDALEQIKIMLEMKVNDYMKLD